MDILVYFVRRFIRLLKSRRSTSGGSAASFEVERKYRLSRDEFYELPKRLRQLKLSCKGTTTLKDTFIPAESRDELIRIRDEETQTDTTSYLTLKKWVELNSERERKESEHKIEPDVRECLLSLGKRLSGSELLSYEKRRTTYKGHQSGFDVTVALDETTDLGSYSGLFIEVEVVTNQESQLQEAREFVERFARELLGEEREIAPSYGEMLRMSRQV